ncbi:TPA: hypothetical protein QFT71_004041 [Raoultella ornithinolytica]|nr:hypothetical protein [Raoultella ornithinolytica]
MGHNPLPIGVDMGAAVVFRCLFLYFLLRQQGGDLLLLLAGYRRQLAVVVSRYFVPDR